MASSRSLPPDPSAAVRTRAAEVLSAAGVGAGSRLLLGLSGGLDSTVLLNALAVLRGRFSYTLRAHHVHHGLSSNAEAWAEACEAQCAALGVPLTVTRVKVEPQPGEGWEAAARRLRHAAWAQTPSDWWVSAHHENDQAETVLFRLLRGAGVHGAAAMRAVEANPAGPGRLRPLLSLPRTLLEAAAQADGLTWVEDESNADPRFTRNFLRHAVMPVIRSRFSAAGRTLARAAAHFDEAARLLDALAAHDAAPCGDPLSRTALQAMDAARVRNLLRWRLRQLALPMPDEARLGEAVRQLQSCSLDRPLMLPMGSAVLHAYRDVAWLTPPLPALPDAPLPWRGAPLDWGEGCIEPRRVAGGGLDLAKLNSAARCVIEARWPGCRIHLPGRPGKAVRQLAQESGLAPVLRDRLPILRVDDKVAWMAGVGIAAGFACPPGAPGVELRWRVPARYSVSGETVL